MTEGDAERVVEESGAGENSDEDSPAGEDVDLQEPDQDAFYGGGDQDGITFADGNPQDSDQ